MRADLTSGHDLADASQGAIGGANVSAFLPASQPAGSGPPPAVISATATQGAIGGANIAPFLPAVGGGPTGGPAGGSGLVATLPKKLKTTALAGAKGVAIKVTVTRAGKVKLSGTVPAKILKRRGKPVVIATGSAIAKRAGTVTVRLRLTSAGRKKRGRLKGARMTLRVSQGSLSSTKRIKLR